MSSHLLGLSTPEVTTVLGAVSVVLAAWFTLPQLLRLVRTRTAAGVSLESLANSAVSLIGWTAYGALHANVWVVAGSAVGLPATLATLDVARRQGLTPRPWLPMAWAGLLVAAAGTDAVTGLATVDVLLGCSILWFAVPAALTAWRSSDLSGLAPQTWVALALEALVFGLYGLVGSVTADRVYGVIALAASAVVLARIGWAGRTGARTASPYPLPDRVLEPAA